MLIFVTILVATSILLSGIIGVTTSLLMQSVSLGLLIVGCLTTGLHAFIRPKIGFQQIAIRPLLVTVVCSLYFLIRAYLTEAVDLGIGDMFLILSAFSVYLLNCYWGHSPIFYKSVIGAISILVVMNLLNFIPYFESFRDNLIPFAKGDKVTGLYNHRNFMSNFLMMSVLMLLPLSIWSNFSKVLKAVCFLLGIAGILGIYIAKSRGSYLGLIAGGLVLSLFIYVYLSRGKKSNLIARVIKLTGILVTFGLVIKFGGDIYEQRSAGDQRATDLGDRMNYFAMGIDQIPDAPWFGSGSMSYSYKMYNNWGDFGQHHMDHVWVHNEFIQVVDDYGVVGLLLIFTLIGFYSRNALKYSLLDTAQRTSLASDDPNIFFRITGFCILVGSIFNMLVSFPAHSFSNFMMMALACAWMCFTNSKSTISLKNGHGYLVGVSLVIFSVFSFLIVLPELKAARVFAKYGIYVDNANWSASSVNREKWLPALEEAVEVAPTYLRYERLSSLYLETASGPAGNPTIDLNKALEASNKALLRHPHYAVAISNHAYSLFKLGKYEEAEIWYKKLQNHTIYRQKYFKPLVKRALNLCYLASENNKRGFIDQARADYELAYELCSKSNFNRDSYSRFVIAYVVSVRTDFLIKNKLGDDLDVMFSDFDKGIGRYAEIKKYPESLYTLSIAMFRYAEYKFISRQPELALKWYLRTNKIIGLSDKNGTTITPKMVEKQREIINSKIIFLRKAQITPAK